MTDLEANYRLRPAERQADMCTLPMQKKVTVVTALTEGNSIRSIERMTGIHRDMIRRDTSLSEVCLGVGINQWDDQAVKHRDASRHPESCA